MLQQTLSLKIHYIYIVILLVLLGCEDESTKSHKPSIANHAFIESLSLLDIEGNTQKVTLSKQKLTLHNSYQPIIIIHLFKTLSIDTQYQLKVFSTLQLTFKEDIFILSVFTGDDANIKDLQSFIKKYTIGHFIAVKHKTHDFQNILYQSLHFSDRHSQPSSILYANSHYVSEYTGTIPIEMMRYTIRQEIKKLKVK